MKEYITCLVDKLHKADKGEEELKKTPKGETDGEGEKRISFTETRRSLRMRLVLTGFSLRSSEMSELLCM